MRWRIYKIIQHDQTLLATYPNPHNHCPFALIFTDIYSSDLRGKNSGCHRLRKMLSIELHVHINFYVSKYPLKAIYIPKIHQKNRRNYARKTNELLKYLLRHWMVTDTAPTCSCCKGMWISQLTPCRLIALDTQHQFLQHKAARSNLPLPYQVTPKTFTTNYS